MHEALIALAVLVALLALNLVGGHVLAKLHIGKLRRLTRGHVVLTYDDGPGERLESRLIEVLGEHEAKATFYLVGARVAERPERCAALAENGHEIASHSQDHVNAWRASPRHVHRDIACGFRTIARWARPGASFRPPYGKLTLWSWLLLALRGAPIAKWTIDTRDTYPQERRPTPQQVVEQVQREGGGVVLLHSFDRAKDSEKEDFVVEVTKAVLADAATHGRNVCTMGELLSASR